MGNIMVNPSEAFVWLSKSNRASKGWVWVELGCKVAHNNCGQVKSAYEIDM